MQDIGADRGILLSEKGFQSGAHRLAARSNITLTSYEIKLARNARELEPFMQALIIRLRDELGLEMASRTRIRLAPAKGASPADAPV